MSKGGGYSNQDAYQAAGAQGQANTAAIRESAKVNAINQETPQGTLTYQRDANGVPISSKYTLAPKVLQFVQGQKDLGNTLIGDANKLAANLPTTPFDATDSNPIHVADDMYKRRMQMIQPQMDQAKSEMNTTLSDRGIPIGSEIYNNEHNRYDAMANEQRSAITNDAQLAAGSESDRRLAQMLTLRAQPYNEVSAFVQGAPAVQTQPMTGGQTNYQVQPPDIGSYLNNAANSRQTQSNSMNAGLFGLGSAALGSTALAGMFSDRRLKKDIAKIGKLDRGMSLYKFRYKWEGDDEARHVGLMSDEVREAVPDAIIDDPSGYDKVDYGRVMETVA